MLFFCVQSSGTNILTILNTLQFLFLHIVATCVVLSLFMNHPSFPSCTKASKSETWTYSSLWWNFKANGGKRSRAKGKADKYSLGEIPTCPGVVNSLTLDFVLLHSFDSQSTCSLTRHLPKHLCKKMCYWNFITVSSSLPAERRVPWACLAFATEDSVWDCPGG